MNILEVKNMSFSFKNNCVFKDFSMSFEKGKIFALLGHNGAGKTTFIRLCLGLLKEQKGKILYFDNPNISYVPDRGGLFEFLTVEQNLNIFLKLNKVGDVNKREYSEKILTEWGLLNKKNTQVRYLSMGQKQRLSLIVAEVNDPDIIFLDEPSSSIDISSQELLNHHMKKLRDEGKTIILSSHDIQLIENVADTILVINNGEIKYVEDISKIINLTSIYNHYTNEDTYENN